MLDVDLVHDAGARRDDLELVEGALAPAQELVALLVALVLEVDVALEGVGAAEHVDDHRVVDDQLGGGERVDLRRVAAELGDGLAHGGEVDDAGDAGEVLHDHPGRGELDLGVRLGGRVPAGQRADVVRGDVRAVLGAQQVLQQHLEAERQPVGPLDGGQPEDLVLGSAGLDGSLRSEAVGAGHDGGPPAVVGASAVHWGLPRESRVRLGRRHHESRELNSTLVLLARSSAFLLGHGVGVVARPGHGHPRAGGARLRAGRAVPGGWPPDGTLRRSPGARPGWPTGGGLVRRTALLAALVVGVVLAGTSPAWPRHRRPTPATVRWTAAAQVSARAAEVGQLTARLADLDARTDDLQADLAARREDAAAALDDLIAAQAAAAEAARRAEEARVATDAAGAAVDDARARMDVFVAATYQEGLDTGRSGCSPGPRTRPTWWPRRVQRDRRPLELAARDGLERARVARANAESAAKAARADAEARQSAAAAAEADVGRGAGRRGRRRSGARPGAGRPRRAAGGGAGPAGRGRGPRLRAARAARPVPGVAAAGGGGAGAGGGRPAGAARSRLDRPPPHPVSGPPAVRPAAPRLGAAGDRPGALAGRRAVRVGRRQRPRPDDGHPDGLGSPLNRIGFDCSGLMLYAYSGAGVALPRVSRNQFNAGRKVPISDLRPGDLVFYKRPGRPIHHVAMYIGGGDMVEAPYTGRQRAGRAAAPRRPAPAGDPPPVDGRAARAAPHCRARGSVTPRPVTPCPTRTPCRQVRHRAV